MEKENNILYQACGNSPAVCALSLHKLWKVDADSSYDVKRTRAEEGDELVVVRTLEGCGKLWLVDGSAFLLEKKSVAVFENSRIRAYRSEGESWKFWWFITAFSGTPPLPPCTVTSAAGSRRDEKEMREVADNLLASSSLKRSYASALFAAMFYRWLSGQKDEKISDAAKRIEYLLIKLRREPQRFWTVEEMAEECHYSVRRFRQVFEQATGQSPKKFYTRIRIEQGRELLRMGLCNITQAADRLGFSSPFHFSRVYKEIFGVSPSDDFK